MIKEQGEISHYILFQKHSETFAAVTKTMRYIVVRDYPAKSEKGINRGQALEFPK